MKVSVIIKTTYPQILQSMALKPDKRKMYFVAFNFCILALLDRV